VKLLAERRAVGKEQVRHVGADEGGLAPELDVDVGEEPPLGHGDRVGQLVLRVTADHLDAGLGRTLPGPDPLAGLGRRLDRHVGHVGKPAQRLPLLPGDVVTPGELVEVVVAEVDGRELGDLEGSGAQDGQVARHPHAQTLGERHHRHHGGRADDDAEQGEERAQRVVPERRQRHAEGVEERGHS
jgi:hypothetical protein